LLFSPYFLSGVFLLIQTIAIIGAGPLGRWLAVRAARAGYTVLLEDVMPSNLHHAQEEVRAELNEQTVQNVRFVRTLEDAAQPADLVMDCVPDELESKLEILWLLDRMAPPRAILATPTLRLDPADLASCTYRPEQFIAMAIEANALKQGAGPEIVLRAAPSTTAATAAAVEGFWQRLGFEPRTERV